MRKLFSLLVLAFFAAPAFAAVPVPEPETLSLIGIGVAGLLISRYKKK